MNTHLGIHDKSSHKGRKKEDEADPSRNMGDAIKIDDDQSNGNEPIMSDMLF